MFVGIISACLLGINTNWKGSCASAYYVSIFSDFAKYKDNILLIPLCPEQLGGLPTPRKPAEIKGSSKEVLFNRSNVVNSHGENLTSLFLKGAYETLKVSKIYNARFAVLKENSPSCGVHFVRNGLFTGALRCDKGITSRVLHENGIKVYSEKEFAYIIRCNLISVSPEDWWLYIPKFY